MQDTWSFSRSAYFSDAACEHVSDQCGQAICFGTEITKPEQVRKTSAKIDTLSSRAS